MSDLRGVRVSPGAVHSMVRRAAADCESFWEHLRLAAARAPVKHSGGTGMRVDGRLRWFHIACTDLISHFRLRESRGDVMEDASGTAVHDHWASCFRIGKVRHALCLAHLVREANALAEGGEAWAGRMRDHHCLMMAEAARRKGGARLPRKRIRELEECYNGLVSEGIGFHEGLPPLPRKGRGKRKRRPGHNFVLRLRDFWADTLRFLRDPAVPATNNLAERDLRPLKVKQKFSGSFRTAEGAGEFAVLRSLIETGRKQGWKLLPALQADPEQLAAALKTVFPAPET